MLTQRLLRRIVFSYGPAEALDDVASVLRDEAWELDGVNAAKYQIVRLHWIRRTEWRTETNDNNVIQVKDEQGPRSTTTSLSVKYDYAMIYGYRKLI